MGGPISAVVAVIPLKALPDAKGRLSSALGSVERQRLMVALFDHVASACLAAPSVERIVVVAGDEAAEAAARRHPVEVLRDRGGGLNAAIALADDHLQRSTAGVEGAPAPATVVVAADLPRVSVADIEVLALLGSAGPCVAVAPTSDGGTGALLRRPGGVIAPAYGADSAARHLRAAASAGIRSARVQRHGLAVDVDRPEDLGHVQGTPAVQGLEVG